MLVKTTAHIDPYNLETLIQEIEENLEASFSTSGSVWAHG